MSNSVGFKDRLSERMKGKKTRTFLLTLLVVIVTLLPLGVNNYVEEVMTNTFFILFWPWD